MKSKKTSATESESFAQQQAANRALLPKRSRSRIRIFILLVAVVGLGLSTRKAADFYPDFIQTHAGDVLWATALYLFLTFLLPFLRRKPLAIAALILSFLVEISQLLDWPILVALRQNDFGKLVLGVGFVPADFLRYAIGVALGVLIDWQFTFRAPVQEHTQHG